MKPELCILIFCFFLLFFLEFSILGQVGRIGTIIFFFSHSRPLLTRFGFKWSLNGWFLIFWIFLLFFSEFSILGRVGRIGTIYFFSLIRDLSWPIFSWNEAWMVLFNFLNFFFLFFFRIFYSESGRNGRNDIFFFSLSWPVLTRFGLKWSLNGAF